MSSAQFAIAFSADNQRPTGEALQPILLRADPSALVFDQRSEALYVADAYTGAIIRVERNPDGVLQRRVATIDSGGVIATNRIGGLALGPDGSLFATRVGYGQAGAIFHVIPGVPPVAFPKVSPRSWRGGIAVDAAGDKLYVTQYLRSSNGPFDGAIVEIDRSNGHVSTVIDGFLHPVGIVKVGPTLVVTDARQRAVFRVGLAGGRGVMRLQLAGDIDRPDSICTCGDDSVLVTTYDDVLCRGTVRRIWLDGRARVIAQGTWEPRGVATDGERVFVAMKRTGTIMAFHLQF